MALQAAAAVRFFGPQNPLWSHLVLEGITERKIQELEKATHQMQRGSAAPKWPAIPAQGRQALFKLRAQPLGFVGTHGTDAGKLANDGPCLSSGLGGGVGSQKLGKKTKVGATQNVIACSQESLVNRDTSKI